MKSGGSSGGGAPKSQPKPQGAPVVPYGQTSNPTPNYVSFLPSDPNASATGLTSEMLAGIDAAQRAPPPLLSATSGSSTPVNPDALRQTLAQQKVKAMRQQQQQLGLGRNGSAGGWR